MQGAGASRRLRARPAWRASASDKDARTFLQARLATLAKVMSVGLFLLLVFFTSLYAAFPAITPRLTPQIFCALAGVLAVHAFVWRVALVRSSLSFVALYRIDLVCAVLTGCAMASAAYFAPERRAAGYAALVQTIFAVFTRAIVLPSSARRTAIVSTLEVIPLVAAAFGLAASTPQDLPGPAFVIGGIVLASVTVVLATVSSRLIYELRRRVDEATQLGQYTLERKIGEGGMGTVYRGHHVLLRRPTAIKLIHPARDSGATLDRFEREVRHTSQLSHPNTVAVFDYGRTADGVFYYAMEYLDGIDLELLVRRFGPLPTGRAIDILVQVCGALQEAHDRGIVHRDIKPANIILCEHGAKPDVAKVVDFGLVKEIASDVNESAGNVLGTPSFVAPEMVTAPRDVTHAADLYALGAVGYFLLTGRRVFEGANAIDVCIKHVTAEPVSPRLHRPDLSAEIETVILRCLRKQPADRYASAAALADALRAVEHGGWSETDAESWWTERRGSIVAGVTPSATTRTVTIDVGRRV